MKVAFLCGSLEPGRDGVGDYVRRMAHQLVRAGHPCQAIALADRFVARFSLEADPTGGFEVVRIPSRFWFAGNVEPAKEALLRFNPDWTSLQMVIYAYERHGLLWKSGRLFKRLGQVGKRHVMLHELWIGESREHGIRDRWLGQLQRRLLLRALRQWNPALIHTSNPVYRELLRQHRVTAAELPLPGNIPVASISSADARRWLLDRLDKDTRNDSAVLAGVFGSLHPEWGESSWLRELGRQCRDAGRRLVLVHLGRAGASGAGLWDSLQHELEDHVTFGMLGELATEDISRALHGLDLGIATTPWAVAGKSGAVAAMLDHGLPVVVTRNDFQLRSGPTPEPTSRSNLFLASQEFFAAFLRGRIAKQPAAAAAEPLELLTHALTNV